MWFWHGCILLVSDALVNDLAHLLWARFFAHFAFDPRWVILLNTPMNEEQLKKLRGYYHSLLGQQRVWDDSAQRGVVPAAEVQMLEDELRRINSDFPSLVPQFDRRVVFSHNGAHVEPLYGVAPIRSFIATAVARLKVEIDIPEGGPVTEHREFSFIKNTELRAILERDYSEIQRAYIAKCWKSVIILSGSAIEAILTDQLLQILIEARASTRAPKEPDISKWDLADLIEVAVERKIVTSGAEKLSHPIREYRNLVHPGNEIRRKLTFGAEEAKIAVEVLHILHRDLSP